MTLRRTSDQNVGYQSAQVSVDGVPAGTWLQPLRNTTHRWLDDTFQIDPALTDQKRTVTITITPTPGAPAWSASAYTVLSARPLSTDHKDPGAVTGLTASGTREQRHPALLDGGHGRRRCRPLRDLRRRRHHRVALDGDPGRDQHAARPSCTAGSG